MVQVRSAETLRTLGEAIFLAAGATPENATGVMASLVGANLAGHDSHGVLRIPSYVADIKLGKLLPANAPQVTHETPATAVVDGNATFGQLGARLTATLAAQKATTLGIGAASAYHCAHTGRIGEWTELGAELGFVTFAAASGAHGPYTVVPFGGRTMNLGTNPFSWAVPRAGGQPPLLLDYATSAAARGKLMVARAAQQPVPPGWLTDKDGNPTTDVEEFWSRGGMMLPFAEHKGYAMSVIVELLAVAMSGGQHSPKRDPGSCLFVACFDPHAFRLGDDFHQDVERIAARLTEEPPGPGFEEILLPGDPENRSRQERTRDGIPLADATWDELVTTARNLGVEHPALG